MMNTIETQSNNDLLVKILSDLSNHHSMRIYKDEKGELKVELELLEQDNSHSEYKDKEFLDTREAADLIHHSVYWLCRRSNREKYGIKLYRIGGKNLFKKKEIMEVIEKNFERKQGRPKKILYVENLECKLV